MKSTKQSVFLLLLGWYFSRWTSKMSINRESSWQLSPSFSSVSFGGWVFPFEMRWKRSSKIFSKNKLLNISNNALRKQSLNTLNNRIPSRRTSGIRLDRIVWTLNRYSKSTLIFLNPDGLHGCTPPSMKLHRSVANSSVTPLRTKKSSDSTP